MQPRSAYKTLEPPKETDTDVLLDGLTRTISSRALAKAEIEREVNEYLRQGGTIHKLDVSDTSCTTNSYTWNRPISEKSQRILETFKKRDKKRRTH